MTRWHLLLLLSLSACAALSSALVFSFVSVKLGHEVLRVHGISMEPALREGDLVILAFESEAKQVVAEYGTGDVVVFHKPGDPGELVAHRAVEKYADGERWYFVTKGDNNPSIDDWKVSESDMVGKVTAVNTVPALFLGTSRYWYATICSLALISVGLLVVVDRTSRHIHTVAR